MYFKIRANSKKVVRKCGYTTEYRVTFNHPHEPVHGFFDSLVMFTQESCR